MASFDEVLKDCTKLGTKIPTSEYLENGKYPIIDQGQNDIAGYYDSDDGLFEDVPTIVFGDHTRVVKYVDKPCFLGADGVKLLCPVDKDINCKYLFYQLSYADIPNTGYNRHFKWVKALDFKILSSDEQNHVVEVLDKVTELISLRKQQLAKLDELVKARFVEMFENSLWPNTSLNDICSEIVDCPHSTPKYEGNLEHPAIRTTEIKKGYIDWDSMKYVSEEEYQKRIKSLKPVPGDIVYGREGTYGNAAIIPDGYEFCLGQRVMLFRPNKTKCISAYVLYAILSDHVKRQADEKNVGATVPHVNVADAKQFDVVLPPLSIQNQFAAFVERVDQQKQTVQQSLEKLELMKKALMQEYFE